MVWLLWLDRPGLFVGEQKCSADSDREEHEQQKGEGGGQRNVGYMLRKNA